MYLKYALSITHQMTRKSVSGDDASFTMIKEQGGVYKGILDNSNLHSELMVKAISENEKQVEFSNTQNKHNPRITTRLQCLDVTELVY